MLLAPERVFKADPVAAEVLRRCTGQATFEEIVGDLAKTYAAPRDRIASDVTTLVSTLLEKRLMELANDEQR
jgi:pyrroloquinoline quinone biosynthesis protein D